MYSLSSTTRGCTTCRCTTRRSTTRRCTTRTCTTRTCTTFTRTTRTCTTRRCATCRNTTCLAGVAYMRPDTAGFETHNNTQMFTRASSPSPVHLHHLHYHHLKRPSPIFISVYYFITSDCVLGHSNALRVSSLPPPRCLPGEEVE